MQSMDKRARKILLDTMVEHKEYHIRVIVNLIMQDPVFSPSIRHILWVKDLKNYFYLELGQHHWCWNFSVWNSVVCWCVAWLLPSFSFQLSIYITWLYILLHPVHLIVHFCKCLLGGEQFLSHCTSLLSVSLTSLYGVLLIKGIWKVLNV